MLLLASRKLVSSRLSGFVSSGCLLHDRRLSRMVLASLLAVVWLLFLYSCLLAGLLSVPSRSSQRMAWHGGFNKNPLYQVSNEQIPFIQETCKEPIEGLVPSCYQAYTMKIWGEVESQRAPTSHGSQTEYGPLYCRTLSMAKIKASGLLKECVTLTRNEDVAEGMFKFSGHDDKNCVLPCKGYMPQFKACLLEKVRLEDDFSEVKDEFYPTVKRLMDGPHKWGVEFTFHGRSVFADKLMEWTEQKCT